MPPCFDLEKDVEQKYVISRALILATYQSKIVELETRLEGERLKTTEKLTLLEATRSEFGNQFQLLANQILEEKTKKFTEQNQVNLFDFYTDTSDFFE